MPVSPERRRLVERLRQLATEEKNEDDAAALRRRADLIEAGGDGGGGTDLDTSHSRPPPKLA